MIRSTSFFDDGFFTQTLTAAGEDAVSREIIACYIDVFNATGEGEWGESWTEESASKKLFGDTAADADRSFVTTWRVDGLLAGFGIAFVEDLQRAIPLRDLPPGLQTQDRLDAVIRHLAWLNGERRICNYRELGVRKELRRGLAPVLQLLHDPIEESAALGATFACCWTAKKSRLFPLITGLDIRMVYDFADPGQHVLMGENVEHILRRFSLPPDQVSTMMAERLAQLRIR